MSPPLSLELYLDHVCPWSYMAFTATLAIAEEKGIRPTWRLLPIAGPREARPADAAMHAQHFAAEWPLVASTALNDFGLRLRKPARLSDGGLAARAVCALRRQRPELESRLHQALFEAEFVHGREIDEPAQLLEILAALPGYPAGGIERSELLDDRHAGPLEADARAALQAGVTAVPTLVMAGSHLVLGAEPPQVLREAFDQLGRLSRLAPIAEIG